MRARYESEISPKLFLIENWAKDGLTNEEISGKLGISISTFYDYQSKHSEFSNALKRGKEIIDYEVEQKLLTRALGYEYVETTREPDVDGIMRITKEVTKIVIPDTTAQIFWLKNRKPTEWRDKQEFDIGGDSLKAVNIKFVNKSNKKEGAEIDPKICGEFTPPSNVDDT